MWIWSVNVVIVITLQFIVKLIYIFRLHLTHLQKLQFTKMEVQINHWKYSRTILPCHKSTGNYLNELSNHKKLHRHLLSNSNAVMLKTTRKRFKETKHNLENVEVESLTKAFLHVRTKSVTQQLNIFMHNVEILLQQRVKN